MEGDIMAKKLINEVTIKYYNDNTIEVIQKKINNSQTETLQETLNDRNQSLPSARTSQILSVLENSIEIYKKYPQMPIKQILNGAVEQTAAELGINKTSVYDKMNRQLDKNAAYWQEELKKWLVEGKDPDDIKKLLNEKIPNGKFDEDYKAITEFFNKTEQFKN